MRKKIVSPAHRRQAARGVVAEGMCSGRAACRYLGLPTKAEHRGHVWSWDSVADATVRGGALKTLTILDEYTRECHVLRADRALRSADVLEWLKRAIAAHGAPAYPRGDNGPEFIANELQRWLAE
ncbi:MAG TPA: DDE-type integrase/transposase/recombinase, partial [Verrucomicrobiae bacterium]|nr:DDE-type integrase/transposase/recombinase [Verrucomicrobiae bacterium]